MNHLDPNGWPCIGKYVGLLLDNDNNPIFLTPEKQRQMESQELMNKCFMASLLANSYMKNIHNNPLLRQVIVNDRIRQNILQIQC